MKQFSVHHRMLVTAASALLGMSAANAQFLDLPNPGAEVPGVMTTHPLPFDMAESPYAGTLRVSGILKKSEKTALRIVLTQPSRLLRLDLRVSSGRVKIRDAALITTSGNRISIREFQNTPVLVSSSLQKSENFSLNESVAEVEILAEGVSEDAGENADLILTALSESSTPQLALWKPVLNMTTPSYVVGKSRSARQAATVASLNARTGEHCTEGYCVGDVVLFQRQRAKITEVYPDGRILLLQRQVRKILTSVSEITRPIEI